MECYYFNTDIPQIYTEDDVYTDIQQDLWIQAFLCALYLESNLLKTR